MTPHKEHSIVPWTIARVKLPRSPSTIPQDQRHAFFPARPRATPRCYSSLVLHSYIRRCRSSSNHAPTVHRIDQGTSSGGGGLEEQALQEGPQHIE